MNLLLTPSAIKYFIYLCLVAVSSYTLSNLFNSEESYWLIWIALTLTLLTSGLTFWRRLKRILATGIGIIASVLVATGLAHYPFILIFYLAALAGGSAYLALKYSPHFFSFLLMMLFGIIASYIEPTHADMRMRLLYLLIGLSVASIYQLLFWPYFIREQIRALIVRSLLNLKLLNNQIFSCFLESAYPDNIYLFERRIHAWKNAYMQSIGKLKCLSNLVQSKLTPEKRTSLEKMIVKLDLLYDTILDYGQLRRRVTDHTTFDLCEAELTALEQEIGKLLAEVGGIFRYKNPLLDTAGLAVKINRFEENYQHVLQVSAREPLVFMLFIASLRAFNKELTQLYADAVQLRGLLQ